VIKAFDEEVVFICPYCKSKVLRCLTRRENARPKWQFRSGRYHYPDTYCEKTGKALAAHVVGRMFMGRKPK